MESFKKWLAESNQPAILYHMTSRRNRQSILHYGLQTKHDQTMDDNDPLVLKGIYLSDKPHFDNDNLTDVWQVDVSGISHIDNDWTTVPEDHEENWYIIYNDVPPSKIKLLTQ